MSEVGEQEVSADEAQGCCEQGIGEDVGDGAFHCVLSLMGPQPRSG